VLGIFAAAVLFLTFFLLRVNMTTGLAVAIPGELRGLELLHYRHGSISWEKLVRPAMELARDGFIVNTHLAKVIQQKKDYIRKMPNLGHMLTKNNDGVTLLTEGDTMIRSQFAKTLEEIMYGGADAFYKGDMANMLAHDIKEAGGIITSEDISNYRPILVSSKYFISIISTEWYAANFFDNKAKPFNFASRRLQRGGCSTSQLWWGSNHWCT
jgi:hypothetical protein